MLNVSDASLRNPTNVYKIFVPRCSQHPIQTLPAQHNMILSRPVFSAGGGVSGGVNISVGVC